MSEPGAAAPSHANASSTAAVRSFELPSIPTRRRIAALTAASLLASGVDAIDNGSTVLGAVSAMFGCAGFVAAATARRLGPFLRWSNLPAAALMFAVAAAKFAQAKVALPTLQCVAAASMVLLAVRNLPRPGRIVVADDGIEVRHSRVRRLWFPWADVAGLEVVGARVRITTNDRWSTDVELADAAAAARLSEVALALRAAAATTAAASPAPAAPPPGTARAGS